MTTLDLKPTAAERLRSPALIAPTVVMAAAVIAVQGSMVDAVLRTLLVLTLVVCSVIDIEHRIIPNRITGPVALAALAIGTGLDLPGEPRRLLWAAVAAGFLLLTALINPAGMGMGDVKLLGVMGLCLGRPVLVALVLALLGSVVAGAAIASRRGIRAARKTGLPFGPYLAVGGVLAAFIGEPLMHAYMGLLH